MVNLKQILAALADLKDYVDSKTSSLDESVERVRLESQDNATQVAYTNEEVSLLKSHVDKTIKSQREEIDKFSKLKVSELSKSQEEIQHGLSLVGNFIESSRKELIEEREDLRKAVMELKGPQGDPGVDADQELLEELAHRVVLLEELIGDLEKLGAPRRDIVAHVGGGLSRIEADDLYVKRAGDIMEGDLEFPVTGFIMNDGSNRWRVTIDSDGSLVTTNLDVASIFLLEDGFNLLLEDGDNFALE